MRLTLGTFKGLRFAGALLLLAIGTALAVTYWNSVAEHRQYLASRNFRLLTVLARQTQNVIDGHGRIFSGLLADANTFAGQRDAKPADGAPAWLRARVPLIPTLQHLDLADVRWSGAQGVKNTFARHRIDAGRGRPALLLGMYSSENAEVLRVRMSIAGLLAPIFAPKLRQGAFDTLVFASQDGQVVFATGRREHELQWTRLDTLLPPARKTARTPFHDLARTTAVDEVAIAGVDYKIFIQPCCRQTMPGGDPKSDVGGMIVAGLVETAQLDSSSRAISPTLVLVGIAAVLLAIVSWPFLKLTLLGDTQRIAVMDVVQLGACSVLGLALATIVALTAWSYWRVNDDVDDQLRLLAAALDENLQQELGRAYRQAECLEQSLASRPRGVYTNILDDTVECRGADGAAAHYPLMDVFALLTPDGYQAIKASREEYATSVISVRRRHYFQAVMQQQYRQGLAFCPRGCVVESLRSWNTGVQQAVLAKPTGLPQLPVATLSIPLRAVIGAVVPPGFEYAVIDREGGVLFHSDPQRNVNENLFQETDFDRRLRAVGWGGRADTLTVDYWGRQYRAFVRPSGVPDWSVVTLFDKQSTRGLNLEMAAVSMLFLVAYMAIWLGVMIVALRMGATWLWPDPRRRANYRLLAAFHAVLLLAFAAVACTHEAKSMLLAGFYLPAIGWLVSYAVLDRAPARSAEWVRRPDPLAEYATMGSLLLLLGGVVPGIAFVGRAHDLQIESFVKHRQLRLSQALAARWGELTLQFGGTRGADSGAFARRFGLGALDDVDLYYRFFYGTSLETAPAAPADAHPRGHEDDDVVLSFIEEYLPYYTEFSVEMRELLHGRADDNSWTSARLPTRQLELTIPRYTPEQSLVVRSTLPTWRSVVARSGAEASEESAQAAHVTLVAVAPLLAVGFAGLAYGIVAFVLRHVFLAQLAEPLWASGRLAATSGDNLFVLCDTAVMETQIRGASPLKLGPIVASAEPEGEWRRALMRLDRADGGRAILIPDLDADLEDLDVLRRKLALLAELVENPARTVVVLSQTPLSTLNAARRDGGPDGPDPARWERVEQRFIVLDWRDAPTDVPPVDVMLEEPLPPGLRGWAARLSPRRWRLANRRTSDSLLAREGRPSPTLRRICDDIRESPAYRAGSLTCEQVLDEIEERALGYYRRVWNGCSDEEKIVLSHVAQHGLANAASRRVVRRLLVRRLLFKDPGLRLMNDTFTRFVVSSVCRTEAARLEGQAEPSTWDRLHVPLAVAAGSAGIFLYLTQRETFDTTLSVIGAVTAAIPVVFRTVSLITDRRTMAGDEGRA